MPCGAPGRRPCGWAPNPARRRSSTRWTRGPASIRPVRRLAACTRPGSRSASSCSSATREKRARTSRRPCSSSAIVDRTLSACPFPILLPGPTSLPPSVTHLGGRRRRRRSRWLVPRASVMLALKRGIDVVLGLALLLAVLPLLAVLAIAVRAETGAPVLFRCQRLGRDGRRFTMYKFRTMAPGSERAFETVRARNVAQGMVKIANDPRVTPLGRLLRRFSLDELPQLWNVVRGEMSLVGPCPHELGEGSLADQVQLQRLRRRPGLTGLWQMRARTNPSLPIRVHYDLEYIARWSLLAASAIALKTIPVVLQGQGGAPRVHGQNLVPEVARADGAGRKNPGVERR